jgi:hypothetical protein
LSYEVGAVGDILIGGATYYIAPAMAAQLIRYARQHGWDPEQIRRPFVIEEGLDVLAQLGYRII